MGIGALNSHASGKKHKEKIASLSLRSIRTFVNAPETLPVAIVSTPDGNCNDHTSPSDAVVNDNIVNRPQDQQRQTPALRVISKDVSKSEILWALKSVDSHRSINSAANEGALFKLMFPDSDIAQTFSLGSDKMAYLIHYGLAPYFQDNLEDKLRRNVVNELKELKKKKVRLVGEQQEELAVLNSEQRLLETRLSRM